MIVATGSVDGILTSAALFRAIGAQPKDVVEFTQAFQVDKLDPAKWAPERQVAFVDLAVNNKDQQMTADFVRRVREAGHTIVAVIDEHDATAWKTALGGLDDLAIKPESQSEGQFKSSGAILLATLGENADNHTRELCEAADAGDRMDFTTHFGSLANQAVKSAIWDNSRRVYLAQHFAANHEPDEKIVGWCAEYKTILRTHEEVLKMRDDLGDGIVRLECTGKTVDMTTLMGSVYNLSGVKVCIIRGEMFNPAKKTKMFMSAFGTRIKDFDILSVIKASDVPASGFASKANVELEDEATAIEAVRAALA